MAHDTWESILADVHSLAETHKGGLEAIPPIMARINKFRRHGRTRPGRKPEIERVCGELESILRGVERDMGTSKTVRRELLDQIRQLRAGSPDPTAPGVSQLVNRIGETRTHIVQRIRKPRT